LKNVWLRNDGLRGKGKIGNGFREDRGQREIETRQEKKARGYARGQFSTETTKGRPAPSSLNPAEE